MSKAAASTVEQYLEGLPAGRRQVIAGLRQVILENLPKGYRECMSFGMIGYVVPLERYPDTYNGQPLSYLALVARKNHCALYLMGVYQDREQEQWLRSEFEKRGMRPDLGKSCLRFRSLEDLPLEVIAKLVGWSNPDEFIARHEAARSRRS